MPGFNEDQLSEFRDAFTLFDDRGDDRIHKVHLGEVVRALGLNPTEIDIKRCLKDLNVDRISFEQFLPIYEDLSKRKDQSTEDDFIEGLRVFDKDGSGMINSAELRHLLTTLGERLSDDEVEQLLNGLEDKHGNVNYEEFVRLLMRN
jgi:myosin light chain 6